TIKPGQQAEQCSDGKDNDCDGLVDAADPNCFECQPGSTGSQACNSGLPGVCAGGTQVRTCGSNGKWGAYGSCSATIKPGQQAEQCSDGKDNDCDGKVDAEDSDCY